MLAALCWVSESSLTQHPQQFHDPWPQRRSAYPSRSAGPQRVTNLTKPNYIKTQKKNI